MQIQNMSFEYFVHRWKLGIRDLSNPEETISELIDFVNYLDEVYQEPSCKECEDKVQEIEELEDTIYELEQDIKCLDDEVDKLKEELNELKSV